MRQSTVLSPILGFFVVASAQAYDGGNPHEWMAPGDTDFRGPCPMLNTLANHAFLPHDGRNFTKDVVINGLQNGLHFDPALGTLMFEMALIANPEPNATFFTLDMLNRHNVLEHDASMTRLDAYFGSNHAFNQDVFDSTKQYWTDETLTPQMLANGKLFRQIQSRAFNPTYRFTESVEQFSLGEVSAPVVAFGDLDTGMVNRTLVEYWLQHERLPHELGWNIRDASVNLTTIGKLTGIIGAATNLITGNSTAASASSSATSSTVVRMRRDMHAGIGLGLYK